MSNAEKFRNAFIELESLIGSKYPNEYRSYIKKQQNNRNSKPASAVIFIAYEKKEFESERHKLDYCCEVRNLLSHKPTIDDKYLIDPSDECIIKKNKCL